MSDLDLTPDDLTAAEFVLGLLTAPEHDRAQRRAAADHDFADLVAAWEARLTPLIEDIAPHAPPAVVWRRVAAQLGLRTPAPRRRGVWNDVKIWRAAAAACLAVIVLAPSGLPAKSSPPPTLAATSVALLKPQEGPAAFVVTFDQQNQRLIIAPVAADGRNDRSLQLWLMPKGAPPVSLGLLDADKALVLRADRLIGPEGLRAALGVSLEPLGGAPGGRPTGPVVATGALSPV